MDIKKEEFQEKLDQIFADLNELINYLDEDDNYQLIDALNKAYEEIQTAIQIEY
jgi:uncharacterized FlaG/YvyC family protein